MTFTTTGGNEVLSASKKRRLAEDSSTSHERVYSDESGGPGKVLKSTPDDGIRGSSIQAKENEENGATSMITDSDNGKVSAGASSLSPSSTPPANTDGLPEAAEQPEAGSSTDPPAATATSNSASNSTDASIMQVETAGASNKPSNASTDDKHEPAQNLIPTKPATDDGAIDLTESPDLVAMEQKAQQQEAVDDDVMIVDPPPPQATVETVVDDSDDELQVVGGNTTNANIHFSHRRPDCGLFKFADDPQKCCDKCYCVACDKPAKECPEWIEHCKKLPVKKPSQPSTDDVLLESPTTTARNYYASLRQQATASAAMGASRMFEEMEDPMDGLDDDFSEYYRSRLRGRLNGPRGQPGAAPDSEYHYYSAKDLRIMDVLAKKLHQALRFDDGGRYLLDKVPYPKRELPVPSKVCSMDGDIPQLKLNTFFVEGVKIGWPFATVLPPQRQMAMHIIKALKRKMHVVIESPTGTGKSAAILCSVLAWQRYHMQSKASQEDIEQVGGDEGKKPPRIIYCSRTQSQVAQMVSSLKKTPYRPRMTVLGSRDRLCIHKEMTGKNKNNKVSIGTACQIRRKNTELQRKKKVKGGEYSDNDPPAFAGDEGKHDDTEDEVAGNENEGAVVEGRRPPPTCPHFRQLASDRTARMIAEQLTGNPQKIKCCSSGGEESAFGVHDMEDLVTFGKNPHLHEKVAVYRGTNGKFGFLVGINGSGKGPYVHDVTGAAKDEGLLKKFDQILSINGVDARNITQVEQAMTAITKTLHDKPLRLEVLRKNADTDELLKSPPVADDEEEVYSKHSVCPYYLSRAIQPFTELTVAPYNYILDPGIRSAMNISLENTVVVLDEAHNVESTLCEGGSGKFGEIDLCQLIGSLSRYSQQKSGNDMQMIGTGEKGNKAAVAHHLLLFVEKIVLYLRGMRQKFDNSPTKANMRSEYERYRNISDDQEEELAYSGPTGWGFKGTPVGCEPFLTELGLTLDQMDQLLHEAISLEDSVSGGGGDTETDSDTYAHAIKASEDATNTSSITLLVELVSKLTLAMKNSEHFYVSCVAQANGNLDHAFGIENRGRNRGWKKKPKKFHLIYPKSRTNPSGMPPFCQHPGCNYHCHGDYCDDSTPPFECHLIVKLLSPGLLLEKISSQCRSLVLASGSLAPLPSLCAELNLYGKEKSSTSPSPAKGLASSQSSSPEKKFVGRLQTQPKPLEANHVIDLQKQLLAVSVGHFADGERLTVTYNNYKEPTFFPKLGAAIASVVDCIPTGGVLVFLPSYSFLRKCTDSWSNNFEIWSRLLRSKGKIIVEPTKSQEEFIEARNDYQHTIETTGSCILLAVFRGKMSEGISFNDDYARGVICVGIPFPNARDRAVTAKKSYNDEQRKLRKNTNLLPGMEWYQQQAQRAIAQALGRCIRHQADYGTIILMDSRHCDDGSPNDGICRAHKNMPKWMRHSIRTLSMRRDAGVGGNPIVGGYNGLQREMVNFFAQCPAASQDVRNKWKTDLEKAKERQKQSPGHVFDKQTGTWSSSTPQKNGANGVKKEKVKSEV